MMIGQGLFAAKLYELERQYEQFQGRMKICQNEDHGRIQQEMQRMRSESEEQNYILKKEWKDVVPRQFINWLKRSWNICTVPKLL